MKKIPAITALLLAGSFLPHAHATTIQTKHPIAAKPTTPHTTQNSSSGKGKSGKKTHSRKLHGQQEIEPSRVTEIQQALIKAHYLTGEPDGNWDTHTIAAMQKFQADNNWQTKLMPDSRALIKLGLGPDYTNAINANGASFTTTPAQPAPAPQDPGFVTASGISR
jgi:peptidoglycan hydrolase-like protein with peptidoglycan-binding domain